jgi:threonine/homoserine/homoserine lactone efflux protein
MLAVLLDLVNAPSLCVWAGFGTVLRPFLSHPARVRSFNLAMALLLVLSLVSVLRH